MENFSRSSPFAVLISVVQVAWMLSSDRVDRYFAVRSLRNGVTVSRMCARTPAGENTLTDSSATRSSRAISSSRRVNSSTSSASALPDGRDPVDVGDVGVGLGLQRLVLFDRIPGPLRDRRPLRLLSIDGG